MKADKKRIASLMFIAPFSADSCIFTIYPVVASSDYGLCTYGILSPPRFAGMSDCSVLLTDGLSLRGLWKTLSLTIFSIHLNVLVALVLAFLPSPRFRGETRRVARGLVDGSQP